MSINLVPEHALPKSFFFEEEMSSSGPRVASESATAVRAERFAPAFVRVPQAEGSGPPGGRGRR
jgi:hypothetical protein